MIKPLDWICLSPAILANLSQLEKMVIISPIGYYLQAGWEPVLQLLIPWICYERSFSEFYHSTWTQLVFNQRLQLFVQSL